MRPPDAWRSGFDSGAVAGASVGLLHQIVFDAGQCRRGVAQSACRLERDTYLVERHQIRLKAADFRIDQVAAGGPAFVILFKIEGRHSKLHRSSL
jgi:hypothetical protein